MIQHIIFDLDNTIILDQSQDAIYYKEVLAQFGYDKKDYLSLYECIDQYEETFTEEKNDFNRNDMIAFLNQKLHRNYSYEFLQALLEVIIEKWSEKVLLPKDIVERLATRYRLYIYTNFFQETQEKRIQNIGYTSYFQKIFGADHYGSKPFKSSFERVLKEIGAKKEECIMIGDDMQKDILAANRIGMRSILFDYDGKRNKKEMKLQNYQVITRYEELLTILS